ncbi:hypothetical protein [Ruminococcus sp. NK3A76]|uniref:hypothetical protein n=1 Tax=Ruminococcus sp. NK3A76 TaxID=877411 RepID=UPI00048AB245|nr:hypothetical protein [Ruminococcus sp. NK3A76]
MPNSNNKLDDNIINTNNIPDPVQADTIHGDMPKISDGERKLRDEYAATVSFEGNLRKFAKGLDAVHWYGAGGVSKDLQAVKDAIKNYFDYRKMADSPAYDTAEEERLVGEIANTANEYIAAKRREGVRNFTGKPNEPQWRPWSDMGTVRFEAAMDIESLANSRKAVLKAANDEIRNINNISNEPLIKDDSSENENENENDISNLINVDDSKSELNINNDNNIINNEEKADENENIINAEQPAKEENNNIEQKTDNVNNNEIIIEEIEKNAQAKEEPKAEEKAKEPEKKEEKKNEPEKNIIIEENKNKIILPEEEKGPEAKETPEQKAVRIKKATRAFNGPRMTVGKLADTLVDMYDYDKLDVDSVHEQAASLISAKELADKYSGTISLTNVSDRFEGRKDRLMFDDNLRGYVYRLIKNPEKTKQLLKDPDALAEGYANYYKCLMDRKDAYDKYGESSAGGYIASAKFNIAASQDDNDLEPYRYLIVAQTEAKKAGLKNSLTGEEYSNLFKEINKDAFNETFGNITPEIKKKILDEPYYALEMYNANAKKRGLGELGSGPVDPLKDKSREELKKKAGKNAGPTIDDELKSLKDYMSAQKKDYMFISDKNGHELISDLAKYTALVKMKEKLGGGDVPISAVNDEYTKAWNNLKYEDKAFKFMMEIIGYDGEVDRRRDYMKNPDHLVEEYDNQTKVNKELSEQFKKYPPGSVGYEIAYIKYLHQRNLQDNFLSHDLGDVMLYHAIGKKMGYDYKVTDEMLRNMNERLDYETYRTVVDKISKADRVNMMSDQKALDKFLEDYNNAAVNQKEPKPKIEFDPLTMTERASKENKNYYDDLLKIRSDSNPHIGDIRKYQNNIRTVINEADPKNMDKEDFEDAKEMIMKNVAQIIATKAIWPKRSKKSITQINQDLCMVDPERKENFVAKYQKQNEDCQELAMNIYENRKDFKRMFDEAKDWKSLVDLSKKALTSSGLEITFKLREVGNKIAVEESKAEKTQNQLNKAVKPKVMK